MQPARPAWAAKSSRMVEPPAFLDFTECTMSGPPASLAPGRASAHPWMAQRPLTSADALVVATARAAALPHKGRLQGTAARKPFDTIMSRVPMPGGVRFEADDVGGIRGWWCLPGRDAPGGAILYLHGGWYSWGTAVAYRNFVGHIVARAGVPAFVADYRLAPEHPFPAAVDDLRTCWEALVERRLGPIAVAGDSAGGGLAFALAAGLARRGPDVAQPAALVAMSPVTDLTLSGASWTTRADADPYFTSAQARAQAAAYLMGQDPTDPQASPLFAALEGLAPLRVHVGDDEVLRDDAVRLVERAVAAGVDARVDVWTGLPHVFQTSVGHLGAADLALDDISAFIAGRLTAAA